MWRSQQPAYTDELELYRNLFPVGFEILVKVRPNAQDAIELDLISNYTYLG